MIISIIPARSGSKGIPKKNIIDFCNKPLIAWSILQAANTPEIDEVYVSSDSDEILDVAKKYGANLIKRPDEIAGDTATSESAVEHALEVIGFPAEMVIMLQATAPLRKPDDLSRAISQFKAERLDSAFSGAVLDDFLIWEKAPNGILNSFNYDYRKRGRRQYRKPQFVENGSFYIFKPDILFSTGNRLGGKIGIFLMDFWQSFEIDTLDDLELVKILFELKLKHFYESNQGDKYG
jgi:N-acylneuraminate cytidylyltransferase